MKKRGAIIAFESLPFCSTKYDVANWITNNIPDVRLYTITGVAHRDLGRFDLSYAMAALERGVIGQDALKDANNGKTVIMLGHKYIDVAIAGIISNNAPKLRELDMYTPVPDIIVYFDEPEGRCIVGGNKREYEPIINNVSEIKDNLIKEITQHTLSEIIWIRKTSVDVEELASAILHISGFHFTLRKPK
ncbi:hypothetical protein D6779_11045 [Candidatus Parcubacteria bacterium]|nr:MAG: hypothetical protein D6779_11045 [Candidatus Parcubacteria bacterium]